MPLINKVNLRVWNKMAHFSRTKLVVIASFGLLLFLLGGCASTKGGKLPTEKNREAAIRVFQEGVELLYLDNEAALDKFDEASAIDPSFFPAFFDAGVALEALGKLEDASKRYEACLAIQKEQENCLSNLLLVKAKLNQTEDARNLLQRYLTESKDAPFAMAAAAELALYEKNYADAEKWARQVLEREAENVRALYVMARVFYAKKRFYAAKWVLKNALEIAPSHGGLYLILGHVYMALDLVQDALDAYALAMKYQPTDEALESYGLLLLKRGRAKEALPILKRLSEMRPEVERNFLHLGNAYFANNLFDEAKAAYDKARLLNPEDKDVLFNLGLLFLNLKPKDVPEIERLKTAQGYFKSCLEPKDVPKERVKEAEGYLKTLERKIESEEYREQAEKEAAERAKEESSEPEKNDTGAPEGQGNE
ncbi:MAG TPA: tetratricopeptide repeat protein [Myxococcota bacterium]|nr:tetratricopeptide repeat protein [Myxococcota bacterium]